ncbi:type II toxin-antitoxin system HicA family toxin [Fibrobacter sp.]
MKFRETCKYAEDRGWKHTRTTGDHYIFTKPGRRSVPVQHNKHEIEGVYLKRILKQFD